MKDKKKLILQVARECFSQYGYKKTTLDDIGKRVGLNKTSLYNYFKNKDEIFISAVLDEFEDFMAKIHTQILNKYDCEDRIQIYFEEYLKYWSQSSMYIPHLAEMEQGEMQSFMAYGENIYEKIEKREMEFLSNLLNQCIEHGHIQDCDITKTAEFLYALVDGIKDKYSRLGKNKPKIGSIFKDTHDALSVFLNGLK